MDDLALEHAILRLVGRPDYRPAKARLIARQLELPEEQVAEVKRAIQRLVGRGQLAYQGKQLVKPADPRGRCGSRSSGVFQRTAKGFGFVRPTTAAGLPLPALGPPARDIYIPAKKAGDASTGDVVLVQLTRGRPGERGPRGEIIDIVQRETHQFVGTYAELAGAGFVQVDGTIFSRPVCVGDPGAKGARPDDKVVIEMVRFPSPICDGEAVLTEVLGPQGEPGVDTLSIIRQFDLPEQFAADALQQARHQAEQFEESVPAERLDLTAETVVTIDPVDARDFDDAISLVRLADGHWQLGVHIADVSHFVRPHTALDREARQRATSVYLPDRVIPMLPEVISNSLASLQPGKIRCTKSAIMEFTPEGLRLATELHSSAIRSTKRLTYEQVDEFLADPPRLRRKLGAKVSELLLCMHELAMVLRRRRLEHGALELTMPEVKVDLDPHGRVVGAHVVPYTDSHKIIEEFMLAANEAVAERLRDREINFLRRVHPSPAPQKLRALTEFAHDLGLPVDSLQSRFELQKLLAAVVGKPEEYAVNYAVLRSLQRAVYSPQDEGHYALASDCYCHFTSPIRRYPDLTVHRLVDALLRHRKPHSDFDELMLLGQHCSDREQRAEAAERDLTKLKLLAYLSERIGEEMDAVVTGVENFGLFVQGIRLPAEGLIRVESLSDDYYHLDRTTHTLTGHQAGHCYRLGDLLHVAVLRVDLERRELDFRLVRRIRASKSEPPARVPAAKPLKGKQRASKRQRRGRKGR